MEWRLLGKNEGFEDLVRVSYLVEVLYIMYLIGNNRKRDLYCQYIQHISSPLAGEFT